mmetsp:Transcript_4509/g.11020  ORF Transcript_4509/g.11020 Transcript_4509/m.11020 type:complete len:99 (+) Transcript_4509:493-789(+)
MVAALFVSALEVMYNFELYISVFMSVWWAVGTGLNTSAKGPGSGVGNIYYFSWISLFCSIMLLYSMLVQEKGVDVVNTMKGKNGGGGGGGDAGAGEEV